MSLGFGSHTGGTGHDIFLYEVTESGPGIIATNKVNGFVLTGMSGENMIVLIAENTEPKVVGVRNVDKIVVTEKSVRSDGVAVPGHLLYS